MPQANKLMCVCVWVCGASHLTNFYVCPQIYSPPCSVGYAPLFGTPICQGGTGARTNTVALVTLKGTRGAKGSGTAAAASAYRQG